MLMLECGGGAGGGLHYVLEDCMGGTGGRGGAGLRTTPPVTVDVNWTTVLTDC